MKWLFIVTANSKIVPADTARIVQGREAYLGGCLHRDRHPHFVVTTMCGINEELRFIEQVTARVQSMRLSRFPVRVKEVLGEFPSRKRIPEKLRVKKSGAEFRDDLFWILRNVRILDLHQRLSAQQHGAVGLLACLPDLSGLECQLTLEEFSFRGSHVKIEGGNDFSRALPYAHVAEAVFARVPPI